MDIAVTILEYKRQMQVKGYAKNTITLYSWGLDCFRDYLEAHHINDIRKISPQTIEAYQAKVMAQPIAMETKALKLRAVKRLFESLEQNHQLLINPAQHIVETNRQKRMPGVVLTIEEMKRLLDQPSLSLAVQIRDKAIMEVLYSTAIRSNELLSLQVYDVDLKDQVLYIRKGKGKKQRVVPLGKHAVQYLKEYLEKIRPRYAKKNPKERALFLTNRGPALTWNAIRANVNDYRKKAGIRKTVGIHTFRRSCATHMLQQGADIRYIQKLLGHKYLKTTQVYTRVMPVDVKKTHEATHPNIRGSHED